MSNFNDGLPTPDRYWALATILLGSFIAGMDTSICTSALPLMERDFHVGADAALWVVSTFQIVMCAMLLPLAALGEKIGYRRIYQTGLVIFTLASLSCALSNSLTLMTISRALQALGASCLISVTPTLVRSIFPESRAARGAAINTFIMAFSFCMGPVLASVILQFAHWPALFYVNVPIGIVAFCVALRTLPDNLQPKSKEPFDWTGAGMTALAVGMAFSSLEAIARGGNGLNLIVQTVTAVFLCLLLYKHQSKQTAPILPLDLLRIPVFGMSALVSVILQIGQMASADSLPFYWHGELGRSVIAVGYLLAPWSIALAIAAPISARLLKRVKPGVLSGVGAMMMAVCYLLLLLLPKDPGNLVLCLVTMIGGAGVGIFNPANTYVLMQSAPKSRGGGISGTVGAARNLGQGLGTAMVSVVFLWFGVENTSIALTIGLIAAIVAGVLSFAKPDA